MLVSVEGHIALAGRDGDRHDLVLESAFCNGLGGPVLGFQGKGVLVFARQVVLGGQVLGRDAHVAHAEGVGEHRHHHVDELGVTHAGAVAHGLA